MDHYQHIYSSRAAEYHQMITAEDVEGNLLAKLVEVADFRGKRILDLGTGTGRLPLLLSSQAGQVIGLDLYLAMLRQNQIQRQRISGHWYLVQADMRTLPIFTGWADIAIAGWAIAHLRDWFSQDWQAQIGRVLNDMQRVTRASGKLIILETMGTGKFEPAPPVKRLAEFYAWLEEAWGYQRHIISTDYQFDSVEQAVTQTEFFFGSQLAVEIRHNGWSRLPEWTGVWVKQL